MVMRKGFLFAYLPWLFLVVIGSLSVTCGQQTVITIPPTSKPPDTARAIDIPAAPPLPVEIEKSIYSTGSSPSPSAIPRERSIVLEVAPGTEARYMAREQLAGFNFPSDAIGATRAVTGVILLRPDNSIVEESSRLVADLRLLASDEGLRDRYLRENTLETGLYPFAEFIPRLVTGLPLPRPQAGKAQFQVTGDMTLHGDTMPLIWDVTASWNGESVNGRATTSFRFGDFNMTIPRVLRVISIVDNIRLEVDFRFYLKVSDS